MFKRGDRVQFSKFGQRGLIGFVRDVQGGKVLVQWRPGETQLVRSEDLVKLPNERSRSERFDRMASRVVAVLLDDYGISRALAGKVWNDMGLKRVYDAIEDDRIEDLRSMFPRRMSGSLIPLAIASLPDDLREAYKSIKYDIKFEFDRWLPYWSTPAYRPEKSQIEIVYNLGLPETLQVHGEWNEAMKKRLLADVRRYDASIRHEVTHALRDAKTKHIKRFIERKESDARVRERYNVEHDRFEFERDAIVNSIAVEKAKMSAAQWDDLTVEELDDRLFGLHIMKDLRGPDGRLWAKRLIREGLAGRKMTEQMRAIVR